MLKAHKKNCRGECCVKGSSQVAKSSQPQQYPLHNAAAVGRSVNDASVSGADSSNLCKCFLCCSIMCGFNPRITRWSVIVNYKFHQG